MTIKNVICDIDGVLMHDNVAVPGAAEFLHRIIDKGTGQRVLYLRNGDGRFFEASGREKSLRGR